jgi:hypothetical protein
MGRKIRMGIRDEHLGTYFRELIFLIKNTENSLMRIRDLLDVARINGAGSGRPKSIWILRIRHRNTGGHVTKVPVSRITVNPILRRQG